MQKEFYIRTPNQGQWQQNRWWIYQRERFPLGLHGLLIFIFSLAAVGYSHVVGGHEGNPGAVAVLVSFIGSFIIFVLMRIADEFKDHEDDARFRPYRAVPRGLVSLSELGMIGAPLAALQLAVAFSFSPRLALLLFAVWAYFILMSKEFFVPRWLKANPVVYLVSHMLIMPLIALFASAPAWIEQGGMPDGLPLFLWLTFFIGMVGETGRKIRAPGDEEIGVETYSALWGRRFAVSLWLILLLAAGVSALRAVQLVGAPGPIAILLLVLFTFALVFALRLIRQQQSRDARAIETISGLWALVIYGGLAVVSIDFGFAWS